MQSFVLILLCCLVQTIDEHKKEERSYAGISVQIVGLAKTKPDALLLTFDADESFRTITSKIIGDKELAAVLKQCFNDSPNKAVQIVLHIPNEKGVSFEMLGNALRRIHRASCEKQNVTVFVHSSRLAK